MYAGEYLANSNNIGHEVINLFKDDNGNNYIYVCPSGVISKEHNGKVEYILLVRSVGNNTMEVIAKTDGKLEQPFMVKNGSIKSSHKKQVRSDHDKYIADKNISYGGVKVNEIYGNAGNNEDWGICFTFKAEKIIFPKQAIYITDNPNNKTFDNIYCITKKVGDEIINDKIKCVTEGKNLSKQSLRMFYSSEYDEYAYGILKGIINDASLWDYSKETEKIDCEKVLNRNKNEDGFNFLKLIKKEYDELSYSNMLQYYFSANKEVFKRFCNDVLKISTITDDYEVKREEENIDLLIEDAKNVIVIENKIKSGINGAKHNLYSDTIQSQLIKYYEYANEKAKNKGAKLKCFILTPNYHHIDLCKYEAHEYYKDNIIYYDDLYQFFKNEKESFKNDKYAYKYYDDFIIALKRHSEQVDNDLYKDMELKFAKVIKTIKDGN
jgi:hypothetical protein